MNYEDLAFRCKVYHQHGHLVRLCLSFQYAKLTCIPKLSLLDQEGVIPSLDCGDRLMIIQIYDLKIVDIIDPPSKFT